MFQQRAWSVETSTAQGEIIGRRHYGRKAVPAGGGGGRGPVRELFDTLLLWKARIALDGNGEAVIEVPLNDSLTSFRLVAVADDGAQRFGTGSATIRVTQDLQILSGLPPLVRDGDQFAAMLRRLGLRQADNGMASSVEEAEKVAERIGYPVLVRPSYVLGGRAMEICYDRGQLLTYVAEAVEVSAGRPVLVDDFLEEAIEIAAHGKPEDAARPGERGIHFVQLIELALQRLELRQRIVQKIGLDPEILQHLLKLSDFLGDVLSIDRGHSLCGDGPRKSGGQCDSGGGGGHTASPPGLATPTVFSTERRDSWRPEPSQRTRATRPRARMAKAMRMALTAVTLGSISKVREL